MMRSLYTAASGMIAQQTNVDVISNNIANVNSTGFKASTAEFKSLLYQTLQSRSTSANGDNKPVAAQVGTGVRNSAITTYFTQGSLNPSDNEFAFAIDGEGFFASRAADGSTYYTRNGDFQMGVTTTGFMLCTSDGFPVLDSTGVPIEFDATYDTSKISVTSGGNVVYTNTTGVTEDLGIKVGIYQFANPAGLKNEGGTFYSATAASGAATEESTADNLTPSTLTQGALEASNVEVAKEMIDLIVAQRAYEMNSKAIQASDEMLSQANELRR